jgi:hypothetical protein
MPDLARPLLCPTCVTLYSSKNGLTEVVEALWSKFGNAAAPNDADAVLALLCSCNSSNPSAAVASLLSAMCGNAAAPEATPPVSLAVLDAREQDSGLPAIFVACQRGSACAVEQLCHAGASVTHTDVTGRTLLHYLAAYVAKLHPHTVLVVAAASCGLPTRYKPGTKYIAVRAPHGNELLVPKGSRLLLARKTMPHLASASDNLALASSSFFFVTRSCRAPPDAVAHA